MERSGHHRLLRAGSALIGALVEVARQRPEVRTALRELTAWVTTQLNVMDAPAADEAQVAARVVEPTVPMTLRLGGAVSTALVPLAGARPVAEADHVATALTATPQAPQPVAIPDLTLVVRRARLKGRAAKWAVERRRRVVDRADHNTTVKPTDEELLGTAKSLSNCYLWMLNPYGPRPSDELFQHLGECYENLATVADIALRCEHDSPEEGPTKLLLQLAAEAQSALRAGLEAADCGRDFDQSDAYTWIRHEAYSRGIYLERYLSLDDSADYTAWLDLRKRLDSIIEERSQREGRERHRQSRYNRILFHFQKLDDADEPQRLYHWTKVLETLSECVNDGQRPSDPTLRDLVAPRIDDLPEAVTVDSRAQQVLDAVDTWISDRESLAAPQASVGPARSPELDEATRLLRGSVVLLFGGQVRSESRANLERDLELAELRWIATAPHQPLTSLEPQIARADVDLVLRAVRWTSHMHSDLKLVCEKHGKPFVNLSGGYGSNQVASQILKHASRQLKSQLIGSE